MLHLRSVFCLIPSKILKYSARENPEFLIVGKEHEMEGRNLNFGNFLLIYGVFFLQNKVPKTCP